MKRLLLLKVKKINRLCVLKKEEFIGLQLSLPGPRRQFCGRKEKILLLNWNTNWANVCGGLLFWLIV